MKKCTMLSLDISSVSTGWAIFENGKYVKSGTLTASGTAENHVPHMMTDIDILLSHSCPDICVIEETILSRFNPKTFRTLTMILGAAMYICKKLETEFITLTPSEWRKLISAEKKPRKREELKAWDLAKAAELFGKEFETDDEADAVLIGQAYLNKWEKKDVSK